MYGSSESRSGSFQAGMTGTGDKASSLSNEAAGYNSAVKQRISNPNALSLTPTSVLQPYMASANGMSTADAGRQTPSGQLPSMNGYAASTYSVRNPKVGYSLKY